MPSKHWGKVCAVVPVRLLVAFLVLLRLDGRSTLGWMGVNRCPLPL